MSAARTCGVMQPCALSHLVIAVATTFALFYGKVLCNNFSDISSFSLENGLSRITSAFKHPNYAQELEVFGVCSAISKRISCPFSLKAWEMERLVWGAQLLKLGDRLCMLTEISQEGKFIAPMNVYNPNIARNLFVQICFSHISLLKHHKWNCLKRGQLIPVEDIVCVLIACFRCRSYIGTIVLIFAAR